MESETNSIYVILSESCDYIFAVCDVDGDGDDDRMVRTSFLI